VIAFETEVRIDRPIEEVFAYVSDPLNFPCWNSAVQTVRKTSTCENGVASTYSMERKLPTGRAVNELEVLARERPSEFAIRTTAEPTPFLYRYRFSAQNGETLVHLRAELELPGAAAFLPQLARSRVRKGVDENLATLGKSSKRPVADRPSLSLLLRCSRVESRGGTRPKNSYRATPSLDSGSPSGTGPRSGPLRR
jgi:uncharacterized protein YndB with AHSA1/START domain